MSVQKQRSVSYWPTMRLTVEGNTVEIAVYKMDGSASHVRKSAVSRLPEILEDVQDWIIREVEIDWLDHIEIVRAEREDRRV